MPDKILNLQFSERLRELMIKRGHASRSAASGASPAALCKAIGCFSESALRYLDGRSIPNPENILKISEWLEVEPGYLLFGDRGYKNPTPDNNSIKLNKELFEYALKKIVPLLKNNSEANKIVEFLISILSDLSLMQLEVEPLKKVFDLTIKSNIYFSKETNSGSADSEKAKTAAKVTP